MPAEAKKVLPADQIFRDNFVGETRIEFRIGPVAFTLALEGQPEFAVADGAGPVFVNIEDKNTLVKLDAKKMTVLETWPLALARRRPASRWTRRPIAFSSVAGART